MTDRRPVKRELRIPPSARNKNSPLNSRENDDLAHIQTENLQQNVQKMYFWQKAPGVNGLIKFMYVTY